MADRLAPLRLRSALAVPTSEVTRARAVVLLVAVAAGAAVAFGSPLLGAALVGPVVLLAAIPDIGRLGQVLVFAGFVTVAAISDTVGNDPGVQQGDVHFSPVKWLSYALLIVGTLALLLPDGRPAVRLRLSQWLIVGYLACSCLGAALNPEPSLFLLRWAQVCLPLVAALVWWRRRGSSGTLVIAVLLAATGHVVAAGISVVLGRSYLSPAVASGDLSGEGTRLGGVVHPVLLALSAAVVAAWALWLILCLPTRRALPGFVALPVAGMALGLSRGRTGFLAVVVMVVAVAIVARRRRRGPQQEVDPRLLVAIGVGLGLVVFSATIVGWFIRGNAGEIRTLTNRTRLWNAAFKLVAQRPILGWGPGLLRSGKVADAIRDQVGFVGHAHNALLDASLAGGVLGAGLWLLGFLAVGRSLFRLRAPAEHFAAFVPCLWAGLVIWGCVEGNLSGFGFSWFLFLALLVAVPSTRSPQPHLRQSESKARTSGAPAGLSVPSSAGVLLPSSRLPSGPG